MLSFPRWGSNSAPSTPLAEFKGRLRGGRKRGEREGREVKVKKERDGREGRKTPIINFW